MNGRKTEQSNFDSRFVVQESIKIQVARLVVLSYRWAFVRQGRLGKTLEVEVRFDLVGHEVESGQVSLKVLHREVALAHETLRSTRIVHHDADVWIGQSSNLSG